MEAYEKHTREMEEKIKRQREEIHRKATEFLKKLADQENQVYFSVIHHENTPI